MQDKGSNLTEEQKKRVAEWIQEGQQLSDIQAALDSELGIKMTYMEVRFLVDDLGLTLQDVEPDKTDSPDELALDGAAAKGQGTDPSQSGSLAGTGQEEPAQKQGTGKVRVSIDNVARPDAVVSGNVTFSDGMSAEWYIDQMGRLGLLPQREGYQPSQQDVQAFQSQLQNELARMGF